MMRRQGFQTAIIKRASLEPVMFEIVDHFELKHGCQPNAGQYRHGQPTECEARRDIHCRLRDKPG